MGTMHAVRVAFVSQDSGERLEDTRRGSAALWRWLAVLSHRFINLWLHHRVCRPGLLVLTNTALLLVHGRRFCLAGHVARDAPRHSVVVPLYSWLRSFRFFRFKARQ